MIRILQKIKHPLRPFIPVRGLGIYHDVRSYFIEREHFCEFQQFYGQLKDKHNIFYIFFTTGLLHWLFKALEFIPDDTNIVLIGSNLTQKELACIEEINARPFHHIRLSVDDGTVWEFLFKINRYNFGWLDVDCFVLNPQLFIEMTEIKDDVAINGGWSYTAAGGVNLLWTYFMFLNIKVIRELKSKRILASPCIYNYEGLKCRVSPYAFAKIPTSKQIKLLKKILPMDNKGQPVYPLADQAKFDTLTLYQLIGQALGYQINQVRKLRYESHYSFECSDELIHPGAVSYYRHWKGSQLHDAYKIRLQLDFLILNDTFKKYNLREDYIKKHHEMRQELMFAGLSPLDAKLNTKNFFLNRGVSNKSICRKGLQSIFE